MRYAIRTLFKSPGFALAAILTLGLAIGANTAFFSVINGILIQPLPYPEPDRLVVLKNTYGGKPSESSVPDYLDRTRGASTLQSVGAYRPRDFNLTSSSTPAHLPGAYVTASFFQVLGVMPALGRLFTPEEDQPGANNVVILSSEVWQEYFGSDPNIVGQQVSLDGDAQRVIGVMPRYFRMPFVPAQIWRPIAFTPAQSAENQRGNEFLTNIARLKSGSSVEQARAEVKALAARYVQNAGVRQQFVISANFGADASSLVDDTTGAIRTPLLVLLAAAGLVLLIALANVANLLLARSSARRREIFIRTTLGASRSHIVRQLLAESMLLSFLGGLTGLAFAYWGVRSLVGLGLQGIPRLNDISIDYAVVGFALALSFLTGIFFAVLPAWTLASSTYSSAVAGSRGAASSGRRFRHAFVVAQVAIAQVLLVGAGLLIGSLDRLMTVDPGFSTDHRIAFRVALPLPLYPNPESQSAFFTRLLQKLQTLPGIHAAGLSTLSPFDVHNETATFHVEGREELPGTKVLGSELRKITGGYPAAIGIPLIAGRTFSDNDRAGSPPVALVDQKAAQQLWPGQDPLGKRIRFGPSWREVVGVVGTVKNERLDADGQYQIYVPSLQAPEPTMVVALQTTADVSSVIGEARSAVSELDRTIPVFDVRTLEERVRESLAPRRYSMTLLGGFGIAGMLVSVIGLYGVIAYSVRQRTQEIGIRIALGAPKRQVVQNIVGQGVTLAFAGVLVGVCGAYWLTRFLASMLYGVTSTDPVTFSLVAALLLLSAVAASYFPAARAAKLDPASTLRGE